MRNHLFLAALLTTSVGAIAQEQSSPDRVTLKNGDQITGKITTMADGKVTIESPVLDELVIPMADITDMSTDQNVTLRTKSGDLWERRIVGIEAGALQFDGGYTTNLPLADLDKINPPQKAKPKWSGSLKFTGTHVSGNTQVRSAGLFFEAVRKSEIDRLSVDAQWDYAEQKPAGTGGAPPPSGTPYVLSQRRTGAGLKYDYFVGDRSYTWVATRALGDTIANLDLRFTASAGFGYQLIDTEDVSFLLEAGLSYFNENYRIVTPPNPGETDFLAARIAYRYENQLSEFTKLVHRAEAFPSLESGDDIYCQVTTELSTSLTESMIASLTHVLDYDNTPSPGFKRADNRVILSVGWSF